MATRTVITGVVSLFLWIIMSSWSIEQTNTIVTCMNAECVLIDGWYKLIFDIKGDYLPMLMVRGRCWRRRAGISRIYFQNIFRSVAVIIMKERNLMNRKARVLDIWFITAFQNSKERRTKKKNPKKTYYHGTIEIFKSEKSKSFQRCRLSQSLWISSLKFLLDNDRSQAKFGILYKK